MAEMTLSNFLQYLTPETLAQAFRDVNSQSFVDPDYRTARNAVLKHCQDHFDDDDEMRFAKALGAGVLAIIGDLIEIGEWEDEQPTPSEACYRCERAHQTHGCANCELFDELRRAYERG